MHKKEHYFISINVAGKNTRQKWLLTCPVQKWFWPTQLSDFKKKSNIENMSKNESKTKIQTPKQINQTFLSMCADFQNGAGLEMADKKGVSFKIRALQRFRNLDGNSTCQNFIFCSLSVFSLSLYLSKCLYLSLFLSYVVRLLANARLP